MTREELLTDMRTSMRDWANVRREYMDAGKPQLAGYCDAAISLVSYISEKYAAGDGHFTAEQILNFFKMTI